jgi:UDP-apiose/xylose synthase
MVMGHYCVLGAGGFLGSHLTEALLALGADVTVTAVDTCFDKLDAPESDRLRLLAGSVADETTLDEALQGDPDAVLSLTALCNPALYNTRPREVIDANFTHLIPLVDRCTDRGLWLIHFSTCEVYGRPTPGEPMNEERSPLVLGPVQRERWSYACAKQLLERLIWAQHRHARLPCTIIRPFNVIGPRMDFLEGVDGEGVPRVLACFMRALLAGEPLKLVEGGAQRRAFISVGDFVGAVLRVVARPAACKGQVLNIGNPDNDVTIAELARRMIAVFGSDPGCKNVDAEAFYGPGYDDAAFRIPDIERARGLLEWEPSESLEQMLPPIVEDYVRRYRGRL